MSLKVLARTLSILLIILGIVTVATLGTLIRSVNMSQALVTKAANGIQNAERLQASLLYHNYLVSMAAMSNDRKWLDDIPTVESYIRRRSHDILLYVSTRGERRVATHAQSLIDKYLQDFGYPVEDDVPVPDLYQRISTPLKAAHDAVRNIIMIKSGEIKAIEGELDTKDRLIMVLGIIEMMLLIGLIGVFVYGAGVVAYAPLASLRKTIVEFGRGNREARAKVYGVREVRDIAVVFNEMATTIGDRQQQQERFLGTVSREVRNPITAISMMLETIINDPETTSSKYRDLLEEMQRRATQMKRLISDILDSVQIPTRGFKMDLRTEDIRKIASDTVHLFLNISADHRIELEQAETPVRAFCDPVRLEQVLNNLMSNAIKYSPLGGRIILRVQESGESALISILDEGIGIDRYQIDEAFMPFQRATAHRDIPGVSLGLATSRRLIEAQGGNLSVESDAGQGSRFIIKLPLAKAAPSS